MKSTRYNDEFVSLVYSLVNDALDILPDDLEKLILKEEDLNLIMEGAVTYEGGGEINFSLTPNHFGVQASYVVLNIFGSPPSNVTIPQSIYYEGYDSDDNFPKRIRRGVEHIQNSENKSRDMYNLALNLLVDMWITNFKKGGYKIGNLPKEGVYLRNSNEKLYCYEEV